MKAFRTLGAALIILVFTCLLACSMSSSAPGCNDERTKELAIKTWKDVLWGKLDLLNRRTGVQLATRDDLDSKVLISIENIRTLEFKKDIGTYVCSGDIIMERKADFLSLGKGEKSSDPVSYKSELILDKKRTFMVTIIE